MSDEFGGEERPRDPHDPMDKAWVPDDALAALVSEAEIHPEESPEQTARRLLLENVGPVTLGIIHTALHGTNERTRLDAQKYVMERVLGRVGDDAFGAERSPVDSFVDKIQQ